jgi:hypothetical protein
VDEFQDCSGDLLDIVKGLSRYSHILVAADPFQLLDSDSTCCAFEWLRSNAELTELSGNQRTRNSVLQSSANALRASSNPEECIAVHLLDSASLSAWVISAKLAWGKLRRNTSRVILSPVRAKSSPWVRDTIERLTKPFDKHNLGPQNFTWEATQDEEYESVLSAFSDLNIQNEDIGHHILRECLKADHRIVRQTAARAIHLLSLRGESGLPKEELVEIAGRCCHAASAFGPERPSVRRAMTIHGAKNREFDYVFILWPYQIPGSKLFHRKLLYNAVTRAKLDAVLLVQGGEKRLEKDELLSSLRKGVQVKPERKASR